ncbi:MAG TPA: tetratricopeptide repeat protein [Usitatibacter sp.]|nr:tetratricopeptide repeat protein [Usitatibacter sp.]
MKRCSSPSVLAAITTLLALCGPAPRAIAADDALSRTQALHDLADDDVSHRRAAVVRLGELGEESDAKALVAKLKDADETIRSLAEESLWKIWSRSGDPRVDALYERGVDEMSSGSFERAVATFTRIIEMRPQFAEAWNKRATLYFMAGDYEKSLADCAEVMKRNPLHFGALAGYFQIYVALDDFERAVRYGRRALDINPNMEGIRQGVEALERKLGTTRRSA